LADALPGDFAAIDIVKLRTREPELCLIKTVGNVDQADIRKELRDAAGIDIRTGRHLAGTCGFKPIIEERTLSLNNQL
jgi:hypothetical protein